MTLLLISLALAGDDATRCVAEWTGPVEGCALRGPWHFEATSSTEKGARKALKKYVAEATSLAQAAEKERIKTLTDGQFVLCSDALEKAFVNCFPEPTLDQAGVCFVELKDKDCWNGDVLTVEDVGWRALAEGRQEMCAAVDAYLVQQNYTDVASRRVQCKSTCTSQTVVRCPTSAASPTP